MIIMGLLEKIRGWYFQAKHVRSVENVSAGGVTHWNDYNNKVRLTALCLAATWQAQALGVERADMSSGMLRAATRSDRLRS